VHNIPLLFCTATGLGKISASYPYYWLALTTAII
jgi:hypothetical protein